MEIDIADLKQPEYTGENRCEPCTILNLAIAVVVGSLVARKTKLGGLAAVGISIGLIYVRGYLVPGTPTLTKRYLPPEVLRWFGKETEPELASGFGGVETREATDISIDGTDAATEDAEIDPTDGAADTTAEDGDATATETTDTTESDPDPEPLDLEAFFLDHDVLEPCSDRDDLCLTEEFEADWLAAIENVDETGVDAAAVIDAFDFDAQPETFELESRDDARVLVGDRGIAGRWPSRAAVVADVGASRVLTDWAPEWDAQTPETKGQVLNGLRMFLETCPGAGGEISMDEEVVESCCSSHDVIAVTCDETGERLFEQRVNTSSSRMRR
ncbi:hypothetical protein [Natronorubrum tibetense]|uniref:Uncharacterized protein n=1 Tax=Natronorubrum tibetense GA33 TaxID=1114856 RepID=L9VG00_9EURY|nr:hypothetical protein [Natronorubrum tibetense]ELY35984.1 hypothetical protein C496_22684 [Natronorubrum tibetense GA33]